MSSIDKALPVQLMTVTTAVYAMTDKCVELTRGFCSQTVLEHVRDSFDRVIITQDGNDNRDLQDYSKTNWWGPYLNSKVVILWAI